MRTVYSILMAVLVLVTNTGMTWATHYCGGKAVKSSISVGNKHLTCGMPSERSTDVCNKQSDRTVIRKNTCCKDAYISISLNDTYTHLKYHTGNQNKLCFLKPESGITNSTCIESLVKAAHFNYSPPLLIPDISVLHQVFRI